MELVKIIDLSQTMEPGAPQPENAPPFSLKRLTFTEKGGRANSGWLAIPEHFSTHCDAPYHANEKWPSIESLPLDVFIGPGIVLDLTDIPEKNDITRDDLREREARQNLSINSGMIVLLHTGFDAIHWKTDGEGAKQIKNHPYLTEEAGEYLVSRKIKGLGMDMGSPDESGADLAFHRLLLGNGIIIFEHLTRLDQLPQAGFLFTAFPLKIKGGSGSPVRATGLVFE